jgi:hypothetical protein
MKLGLCLRHLAIFFQELLSANDADYSMELAVAKTTSGLALLISIQNMQCNLILFAWGESILKAGPISKNGTHMLVSGDFILFGGLEMDYTLSENGKNIWILIWFWYFIEGR